MNKREVFNSWIQKIEEISKRGDDISSGELAKSIAKEVGYDVKVLNSIISFMTGETLAEYIKSRKLNAACKYLTGNKNAEISRAVEISGYDNQSSFSKRFKKEYGITPNEAKARKEVAEGREQYVQ